MIENIRLQNFRSYGDASFEFEPGVNIVVGPNASGKTNLLEAVLVLCQGGSYKAKDVDLVQFSKPWARLDGMFDIGDRSLKLERDNDKIDKSFLISDKLYKRLSLRLVHQVVFFEPNHLQLLSRGPEGRRDYIDNLLAYSLPGYKTKLNDYKRALAQRNRLLKLGPLVGHKQLFAWNIRLSELGSKIVEARLSLVKDINKTISKNYSFIAKSRSSVKLEYGGLFPVDVYGSRLLAKLESSADTDYLRGFTAYGPHREDILFYLNDQPVGVSASRGETRSLVLALKIFELALSEKAFGQKPIFLLDDVFSELDGRRRQALVDCLKDRQTIITTTDADAVIEYFSANHNLIPLS